MSPTNPPILTGDVARVLDVSTRRVQQLEAEGVLRAVRTPRGLRLFDPLEVEALRRQRALAKNERETDHAG